MELEGFKGIKEFRRDVEYLKWILMDFKGLKRIFRDLKDEYGFKEV